MSWPKPVPRQKVRKRLARNTKPIARKGRPARRVHVKRVSTRRGQQIVADAEWSSKVAERDRDVCQIRGQGVPVRGEQYGLVATIVLQCWGGLDSHHVYSKKAHPRLRYSLDNGIRLCRGHHDYAHTEEGKVFLRRWLDATHPFRYARLLEKAQREARLA